MSGVVDSAAHETYSHAARYLTPSGLQMRAHRVMLPILLSIVGRKPEILLDAECNKKGMSARGPRTSDVLNEGGQSTHAH